MPSRRSFIAAATSLAAAPALFEHSAAANESRAQPRVRLCLNTSTVRGHNLSITEQVDLAAQAGYDGIEPWIRDVRKYVETGGSLPDLKRRINNAGLQVESAIGFAKWIVDDPDERKAGLAEFRSDMELLAAIGGTRIAAPPIGMHGKDSKPLDLDLAAERYRAALELGQQTGVVPQLEFWGPSKNLYKLEQALYVASAAGHSDACILPDIYHMFRGGSSFAGLGMLAGSAVHCFHMNDYPGGRERIAYNDSDRVYPGDGVAPVVDVLKTLLRSGFEGALSLELFNKSYWKQPAADVAQRGLQSMRSALAAAIASTE